MCNPMALHCGFPALASASSALPLLLPLALVFVPHTTLSGLFVLFCFFVCFGAGTVTSLKYLALFAVGGMGHSCCHVGWQSMDCLWITLCVPGLGTYGLSFLCFCPLAGAWSNPTKEGIFLNLKMCMKSLCFPAGVQNIHKKGLVLLSCQLPVLRCLALTEFLG